MTGQHADEDEIDGRTLLIIAGTLVCIILASLAAGVIAAFA
jgi:hypothetical protein